MSRQETVMDERGRVTIGRKEGKKYGGRFFVVYAPGEIVLIPKPKDPLKALKEAGKGSGMRNLSAQNIRMLAEEQAYKEIDARFRRAKR